MKSALITGITGQDGAYLAEFLLKKGYMVHGIKRRSSLINTGRIDHLYKDPHEKKVNLKLHYGDLTDSTNLIRIIQETKPDEIYNLAAQSHVQVSFETPEYTANADAVGSLRLLEAIRILNMTDKVKLYQASTSEMFGLVQEVPQSEKTPFYPRSPYGVAKLYAYWITVNYREAYNIFASNGILFNHESPIRGETFVTRKITRAAAKIAMGIEKIMFIGNLSAKRDWGHAKDYVEAMYLILQHKVADDFVIATGKTTTVRDFAKMAFAEAGVLIEFSGKGVNEIAKVKALIPEVLKKHGIKNCPLKKGDVIISVDKKYFRPTEVELLIGNPAKARKLLGWKPRYDLEAMVKEMIESDIHLFQKDQYLNEGGFTTHNYFE